MPELYGQPFKKELRSEISQLRIDLLNERNEHRKTRDTLRIVRARAQELEAKIERMKEALQSALVEADKDIVPLVLERYFSRSVA